MEVSEEMEKLSEEIYAVIYGLPTKKVKFLKDFNGITLWAWWMNLKILMSSTQ